jgi:hypothetical protein
MKKILKTIGMGLFTVIGVLIIIIAGIVYLLFVPFDIIRYHRMPYYKDFKIKYRFFITSRDAVKMYNRIVKENLPMEYIRNNDIEYFIKDGQVLLCGWSRDKFEQENGEWFFVLDTENDTKMAMQEALDADRELLKPEHRGYPAKFLIFYSDITDADDFELAKQCPYLHCVFSEEELI